MSGLLAGLLLLAFQDPKPLEQQSFTELTTDDKDGAFDVSKFLLTRGAFLPVPMVITEPAVGYGGGLTAIFFHKPAFGDPDEVGVERDDSIPLQIVPRSVSFAAAGATVEGSYFAGAGHFEAWDDGSWRALGVGGYAAPHLKYYGEGSTVDLQDDPLEYTIRTGILILQLQRRIVGSLFVGLRYQYLDTDVTFQERSSTPPGIGIPSSKFHLDSAGLGVPLTYDSRDSVMSPTKGFLVDVRPQFYDESFGGDTHFFRVDTTMTGYLPLPPFILAGRICADFVSGKPPFYQLPFVEMRGVPVLRYLGREVLSAEMELEYLLTSRWSVLGFGGLGKAQMEASSLDSGETVYAGGFGFRYLIARRFGLKAGVDFAWSNHDHALYLQIGTAWR